jgi:hypothetical protein
VSFAGGWIEDEGVKAQDFKKYNIYYHPEKNNN